MSINKIINLVKISVLTSFIGSPLANAQVIFEDNFDQVGINSINVKDTSGTGTWVRSMSTRYDSTVTDVSNGLMNVYSSATPYGGVATQPRADFDFFSNEITFTFSGLSLEAAALDPNFGAQGVKIAVGSYLSGMGRVNSWHSYSNFSISYYGSGRFVIAGYNALKYLVPVDVQDIPTPYLNFSLSKLTAVRLTLDDVNYRAVFEFGNPLNSLSFAGPHHLSKDLWHVSNTMRNLTLVKIQAEKDLAAATATGDATMIADAQATLDQIMVDYNAQYALEESTMGHSLVFFGAVSADHYGAQASVDMIKAETTTDLQVLR